MSEQAVPLGEDAPILGVMATMRAMRRLKPDPVPRHVLEQLVEAATWGPSGSNAQAYDFVVVTDRTKMAELAELWGRCVDFYAGGVGGRVPAGMDEGAYRRLVKAIEYQRVHFAETPALIVPCYRYPMSFDPAMVKNLARLGVLNNVRMVANAQRLSALAEASSVYPGVQNLLLAARTLGLAATLTVWHLFLEHEWKQALGIPRQVHTFAVVPVGYPLGKFGPVRRKPVGEVTHWDRW